MSRSYYHWRFLDKTQPPPAWLDLDTPLDSIKDLRVRHRIRYYRTLWHATPLWADKEAIKAIYRAAHERRMNGEDVVVDHVVPLHGDNVCGLHCEANLAITDRVWNAKKAHRLYPGCPQADLFGAEHYDQPGEDAVLAGQARLRQTLYAAQASEQVQATGEVPTLQEHARAQRRKAQARRTPKQELLVLQLSLPT